MHCIFSSFSLHYSSLPFLARSSWIYTSHLASLTINSYRWSFVFVVAYSILWQSLFSSYPRGSSIDLSSKIEECFRPSIMRAFVIVMTIVPRPTATPTDQSINPFIITFIVARRSKQEVHQLPRLSTSIFLHFQQIDKYCLFSASKWTTTPIDALKTMANTLCSVFRRWRLHYGRRELTLWSWSNRSMKLALK